MAIAEAMFLLERQESNSVELPGPEEPGTGKAVVVAIWKEAACQGGGSQTGRAAALEKVVLPFPAGFRIAMA